MPLHALLDSKDRFEGTLKSLMAGQRPLVPMRQRCPCLPERNSISVKLFEQVHYCAKRKMSGRVLGDEADEMFPGGAASWSQEGG